MALPAIFLSHSTQDNTWCRTLVAELQAGGFDVWYDEQGLTGGTEWVQTLQREVQARPIFIPVLTPDAWASRWVQEEIQLAIATQRTIFPLLLKPTVIEGFLLTRQWIDAVGKDGPAVARQVAQLLQSTGMAPPQQLPKRIVAAPHLVPPALQRLGFIGQISDGVEMLLPPLCPIPAGQCWIGTDALREPDFADAEPSGRWVDVPAFSIGKYPVTVAEFAYAVKAQAVSPAGEWARQVTHPDHPVVMVTWKGAWTYVAWLSQLSGIAWQLPTDEQWEKAARGIDGRLFPWGNQWDASRANTDDGGPDATTPIGSYPGGVSPYGVMDMAGNVNEWCGLSPNSLQAQPGPTPQGITPSSGSLRGGAWDESPRHARLAYRSQLYMGERADDIGFRLAWESLPAQTPIHE
jgi:formylglycine-generating enzyme required for sulfatase activity